MQDDDALLLDMLIAAERVRRFASGYTLESFTQDEVLQSAARYQLQIIGEAAWRISDERKAKCETIPWPQIVGFRHRLVHDYARIELPKVWGVIESHIDALIKELRKVVPPEAD
ncbi:MAG: HepT-like ribonuclease domain-containing protein [Phycisphaeraceae bacterium]